MGTVLPQEEEEGEESLVPPSHHQPKLCPALDGAVAEAGEEVLHLQLICRLWGL